MDFEFGDFDQDQRVFVPPEDEQHPQEEEQTSDSLPTTSSVTFEPLTATHRVQHSTLSSRPTVDSVEDSRASPAKTLLAPSSVGGKKRNLQKQQESVTRKQQVGAAADGAAADGQGGATTNRRKRTANNSLQETTTCAGEGPPQQAGFLISAQDSRTDVPRGEEKQPTTKKPRKIGGKKRNKDSGQPDGDDAAASSSLSLTTPRSSVTTRSISSVSSTTAPSSVRQKTAGGVKRKQHGGSAANVGLEIDLQASLQDQVQDYVERNWVSVQHISQSWTKSRALETRELSRELLRISLSTGLRRSSSRRKTRKKNDSQHKQQTVSVEAGSNPDPKHPHAEQHSAQGENLQTTITPLGDLEEDDLSEKIELAVLGIEQSVFDNWFVFRFATYASKIRNLYRFLRTDSDRFLGKYQRDESHLIADTHTDIDPCYVATMNDAGLQTESANSELKLQRVQEDLAKAEFVKFMSSNWFGKSDVVCRACGCANVWYKQLQTRGADEPMTLFFKCEKCKKQWRES